MTPIQPPPFIHRTAASALAALAVLAGAVGCAQGAGAARPALAAPDATLAASAAPEHRQLPIADKLQPHTSKAPWLDARAVARAVRPHHGAFRSCRRLASESADAASGTVTVGWLVDSAGTIEDARVSHSTFSSLDLSNCVLAVARKVEFPVSRAAAEVSWTVRFADSTSVRLASAR